MSTQSIDQDGRFNKDPSAALKVFFASTALEAPEQRPISAASQIWSLPYMGRTLPIEESGSCSALVVFSDQIGDEQTWER